uniref:Uncharacterized protein n=1 Tax=Amphimedon queenslandica TaxID=400682 RepID=A0A1X7TR57_AMPQE
MKTCKGEAINPQAHVDSMATSKTCMHVCTDSSQKSFKKLTPIVILLS